MRFRSTVFSYLCILFALTTMSLKAQSSSGERPRLVVGIMIDGLQQKHIDILWNYFDPNGFKKIIGQGAVCRNISYNIVSAGNAADIASVMTGTTPYYNGVVGDYYYNRTDDEVQSILLDENQVGIGTRQTASAHHLLSSTFSDEIMLAYPGKSKTYAVAMGPEEAIMLGGHTAKSVAWVDDINYRWVTTGYYTEGLSHWADDMNVNGVFENYKHRTWGPLYTINTYLNKPAKEDKKWGFFYDPSSKNGKSSIFCSTPSANGLITELGVKILENEKLGTDVYPDVLMLQYTVKTPNEKTQALQSAEKEDMYLRLDKEIQTLLQKIDAAVGLDKTLVVVFGNQTPVHSPQELGSNKIPAGYFNADRSLALLNSYLMALYGPEKWVTGYYGKNIFLNREKFQLKKINFSDVQKIVADFMLEFEGIQAAYPANSLITAAGSNDPEIYRVRNSTHKKSMGDVIITLLPGWIEVDKQNKSIGESNAIMPYTPVYFFGNKIKSQNIVGSYFCTDIAPTISRILDIPTPNACTGKPIEELLK